MEMEDDCLIVSEDINRGSKKKLKFPFPLKTKQALLSFAPVPNKQKKEMLQKRTANGNSLSSSSDCRTEKKRKLSGPPEDHLPSAKKPASAKLSRYSPAADAEVSSSCDEVSIASPPATNSSLPAGQDKPRTGGLLQHFVRREPTQQDEISTSVRDDKDTNGGSGTNKSMKDDHTVQEDSHKNGCGQKHETFCFSKLSKSVVKDKELCKTNDSSDCSEKAVEEDDKEISETSLSMAKDCSVALERLSPEACASSQELNSDVPRKKRKLDSDKNGESAKTKPRGRSSLSNKTVKSNDKGNLITAFLKKGSPRIKEPESKTLSPDQNTKSADKLDKSVDLSSSNVDAANNTASDALCGNDEDCEVSANVSKVDDSCEEGNSSSFGTPSSKEAVKPVQMLTPKTLAKQNETKKKKEEERVKKQQEKIDLKEQKEAEKAKKEEERLRLKKEKEDELKRQREEKEQLKEEKNRKKQEEIDAKNKEREGKRQKLEEEKRAKEEERQRKDEDKKAKEEEKKRLEQEEEDRKKKVAQKFANFFMANKTVTTPAAVPAAGLNSGPFRQMQVSRNTVLAPVQRCVLAAAARAVLDAALAKSSPQEYTDCSTTYLALLRAGSHTPLTAAATPPPVLDTPDDKDDCLIIEEKDDDDDDDSFAMGESVVFSESRPNPEKYRGKLLKFCENRRPPYWGTWTKKAAAVGPRKPFAKEQIFDYEYDSDDDWEEEEENGESLSDSEGEKDEEEDEQYEVDNDFFVPHGYLSDDEGQEKEDEDESHEGNDEGSDKEKASAANRQNNQEKLKAKQAEFEKELKKETKQLKPRVLGCLWLHKAEEQSGAAYEHLLRVLGGHSGVVCPAVDTEGAAVASAADPQAMGGMIACMPPTPPASPERASPPDQCETPMSIDSAPPRSYCKTFPEEAMPSLVRLVHGNRNGKPFLVREFDQFWRLRQQEGVALKSESPDDSAEDSEPPSAVTQTPSIGVRAAERGEGEGGLPECLAPFGSRSRPQLAPDGSESISKALSKRFIRLKLSEIGEYKRCPDKGPLFNQVMWYVSASIRERYGISDACIPNQWTYCLAPKKRRSVHDSSSCSDAKTPSTFGVKIPGSIDGVKTPSVASARTPATNLITKFTKILTKEEKAALNKKKAQPKSNVSAIVVCSQELDDDDVVVLEADEGSLVSEPNVSSGCPNVISGKRQTPKTKALTKIRTAARASPSNGAAKPIVGECSGSAKKSANPSVNKRRRSASIVGTTKKVITKSGKSPVASVFLTPNRGTSIKKSTPKSSRSIMAFLKKPSESKSPSSPSGAKMGSNNSKGVAAVSQSGASDGSGLETFDSDCIIID